MSVQLVRLGGRAGATFPM